MGRISVLLGSVVLMLAVSGSIATAAKPGSGACSGGAPGFGNAEVIPAGTYAGFTVTGFCVFGPGTMTINGNLTIADGAQLNDHASGQSESVHVTGNVTVGKGAVLGLGDYTPVPPHTSAVVDGNITAHQPETLYLGGMTVHGNLVSSGGGNPASERNFPIKDDTVDGNVIVQGWNGFWLGVIRVNVGGNVIFANNSGTQVGLPGTEFEGILDSNEIVSNVIGGNLVCHGNTPPAQIGDAILDEGNGPNTVGGNALGECAEIED
jgi:hypothetical protein